MIAVIVHGAEGRMGRLISEMVERTDEFELAGLVTEPGRHQPAGGFHAHLPLVGQDRLADVLPAQAVIVDFSVAAALDGLLAGVEAAGVKSGLVIGTTGYSEQQIESLRRCAEQRPIVYASNFSVGIPALQLVLELLARALPTGFQAEQVEAHHRHKIDRPSGTARQLAQAWHGARGGSPPPVHSLRLGGIIGEHGWTISDDEETLQLVHRAHSRRAFLRGIPPAIRFAACCDKGLFGLSDVLAAQAGGPGDRG